MTAEEHLKVIAGDLLVQIALHKAEIDRLQAKIGELEASAPTSLSTRQGRRVSDRIHQTGSPDG